MDKFTFQMPHGGRITDEQILDREDLIARIRRASKPARDVVDTAKDITSALLGDIEIEGDERMREESSGVTQPALFEQPKPAKPKKPKS